MAKPVPVLGERALKVGNALIIADLHIGFEIELWRQGVRIPFQTSHLVSRVNELLRKERVKEVIVNGDLKHEIAVSRGRQAIEIEKFVEGIEGNVKVVQGNHDGGLGMKMYPSEGFLLGNVGIFHGHAYPGEELLRARYWITAHIHPMFGFRDTYGRVYKEPCWVVGRVKEEFLERRYGETKKIKVIVMPAFSEIVGGIPVNLENVGGILSSMLSEPAFFLLDGTEVVFD